MFSKPIGAPDLPFPPFMPPQPSLGKENATFQKIYRAMC